jgi:hypothetical protein
MNDFGSITSLQAVSLGCMRLASRIHDLKRMGYTIRKRFAKAENRYGETVYYAEYYMEDGEDQWMKINDSTGSN